MKAIKFSSNYPKLWNQKEAKLLAIQLLGKKNLNKDLIEYDTKNTKGDYYKLPEAILMQLIFIGDKSIPFCTIRRWTKDKFEWYHQSIGEYFKIIIKEKGK